MHELNFPEMIGKVSPALLKLARFGVCSITDTFCVYQCLDLVNQLANPDGDC